MVSPVGTFFIVLAVLLVLAAVGWVAFTQLRARRLGLPSPPIIPFLNSSNRSSYGAPQSAPGGIRGWLNDRLSTLRSGKNTRSAAGAYEQSGASGRRTFGQLDPDEAWDASVGYEPYGVGAHYPDDQELEDRGHHGQYSGSGYQMNLAGDGNDSRGRSPMARGAGLDVPASSGPASSHNPFDDEAAEPSNMSLRGVSPRPIDTQKASGSGPTAGTQGSPTSLSSLSGRRSVFRENV
ncbi:hypothetical protein F5Y18DRAFT_219808 [Xylariaceae sp. FL1019]|nr:hypothetical protein F5Y18DRAFT_219808 [Xylariaceae sp. FL1019]